ncbi:MAG: metal ABC transporter permease, partial [Firmicutes bacterium]|nr:metal ABC transporter permease [Bacillota bacterium]
MTFSVFHFFQMHVFIWALLVAILVAFSASRVGVPLVLKRYSFAGFGLSKVAFMASALAIIIGLNNELFIVMPLTVGASILILRFGGRAKLRGDAVLAIISIAAIAIGFFLLNTFDSQGQVTQNVTAALFGTNLLILTTLTDVFIALGVAIFVAVILFVLHNRTFSVTFDSNFMRATGQKPIIYEFVIAAIVGVVIAISMQLV